MYNVNEGRNSAIMMACAELKGHAFFVSRAKRLEREIAAQGEGLGRGEITLKAIRRAIRDCKEAGLLEEFWGKMSQEDVNMLANDWNLETALEVEREEGFERGMERRSPLRGPAQAPRLESRSAGSGRGNPARPRPF